MIHVCYCFHDKTGRYAKFIGTSMLSLFEKSSVPVTVHILHDDSLTADNRDKLSLIAERCWQRVNFYNVVELCAEKLAEMVNMVPVVENSRVSVGSFFKLTIPQIIPHDIEKIIYLDADILVNLDINELWQTELGEKILGVVTERDNGIGAFLVSRDGFVKHEDYFNSGVMLMNLSLLRGETATILAGVKFKAEHLQYRQFDQLIFNYCFATRTIKLPLKFNRFVVKARAQNEPLDKKIYHYADHAIKLDYSDVFNRLWMEHFMRTPFLEVEVFSRLYRETSNLCNFLKDRSLNLAVNMAGKTRAFFVAPAQLNAMKKIFAIRDDELVILAENENSLRKLLDAMKTLKGKCLFFIMTEIFLKRNFPFDLLTKAGFALNKDFIKGWLLLSDGKGGATYNSYSLVKAM